MREKVTASLVTPRRSSYIDYRNESGKKAPRKKEDVPKPTELMKAREIPLELDKNLNKTIIVSAGTKGAGQPGFYCDVCNKTSKDSVGYMDHINGRARQFIRFVTVQHDTDSPCATDLRKLGQTTRVVRSSLNDVRQKIADLRAKTSATTESKQYDFDERIREIKALEAAGKLEQKNAKKKKKLEDAAKLTEGQDEEMMKAMGFAGFS